MKVLITGTSSGIGYSLAEYYLDKGYEVYGVSRRVPKGLNGRGYNHCSMDLRHIENEKDRFIEFIGEIKKIETIILNAGILGEIKSLAENSIEELNDIMFVNTWANKILIDILVEHVNEVNKVVAVSSGASINGNSGWGGYSLSKATLNMLIKLYAAEIIDTRFYSFAPGLVDTSMQDYLCGEVDADKFPSIQRISKARNTVNMPTPKEAASHLARGIDRLDNYESGSFVDVRKM